MGQKAEHNDDQEKRDDEDRENDLTLRNLELISKHPFASSQYNLAAHVADEREKKRKENKPRVCGDQDIVVAIRIPVGDDGEGNGDTTRDLSGEDLRPGFCLENRESL